LNDFSRIGCKLSNRSIAITEHEQGAWWQVDLGGQKNIKQIITGSAATIGAPEMVPVFLLKDKPLEIAGEIK
jgi:hypothetical protein